MTTHPTDRTIENVHGMGNVSFYSLSFGWHRFKCPLTCWVFGLTGEFPDEICCFFIYLLRWFASFLFSLRCKWKMWNVFAPLFLICTYHSMKIVFIIPCIVVNRDYGFIYARAIQFNFYSFAFLFSCYYHMKYIDYYFLLSFPHCLWFGGVS